MIRSEPRHHLRLLCVLVAVLTALTVAATPPAVAQEEGMDEEAAEMMAMMAAWAKAATPGEMHDHLDRYEGEWTTSITLWMVPGQEPTTTTGTMSGAWVYGGRYMKTEHTSDMMGQPFHGTGIEGYDTVREVYTSTWYDNASTGILNFEGQCEDADCSTMVYEGAQADPRTGEMTKTRVVVTFTGPDSFRFESFVDASGGEGGETKTMEMTVQRK